MTTYLNDPHPKNPPRELVKGFLFRPECCPNHVFFTELHPERIMYNHVQSHPGDMYFGFGDSKDVETWAPTEGGFCTWLKGIPSKVVSSLSIDEFHKKFPSIVLSEIGKIIPAVIRTDKVKRGIQTSLPRWESGGYLRNIGENHKSDIIDTEQKDKE